MATLSKSEISVLARDAQNNHYCSSHLIHLQKQSSEMFYKKAVLNNFAIFTAKHLGWSLFLINLPRRLQSFLNFSPRIGQRRKIKKCKTPSFQSWVLKFCYGEGKNGRSASLHALLSVVILKFQVHPFSQIFQSLQETNVDASKITRTCTAQKMRSFSKKIFFSKCDQIRSFRGYGHIY